MILNKAIDLEQIENSDDIEFIKQELLKLPGVGGKVADCIMLFALNKFEVFPIDVWVKRVMAELYFDVKENDITLNPTKIYRFESNLST